MMISLLDMQRAMLEPRPATSTGTSPPQPSDTSTSSEGDPDQHDMEGEVYGMLSRILDRCATSHFAQCMAHDITSQLPISSIGTRKRPRRGQSSARCDEGHPARRRASAWVTQMHSDLDALRTAQADLRDCYTDARDAIDSKLQHCRDAGGVSIVMALLLAMEAKAL